MEKREVPATGRQPLLDLAAGMALIANAARDSAELSLPALALLGEHLEFSTGYAFRRPRPDERPETTAIWSLAPTEHATPPETCIEFATRAFDAGRIAWVEDAVGTTDGPARGLAALPVVVDGEVAVVFLLFAPTPRAQPGATLMRDLDGALVQIGHYFRRERNEALLKTARENAEQEAAARTRFFANISHEVRTPLNAIIGLTSLALDTALSPRQRDYLERVAGAARSLLGIVNDLLDLTKIESGIFAMEEVPFSLNAVIDSVASVVSVRSHEKGIWIHLRRDLRIPDTLVGDPLRLTQIIINLVNNALKFTDEGEVLLAIESVAVTPGEATVRVRVRDTGIGMSEETIETLFRPFMQADSSITRRYGGTGLGLSITQLLLEKWDSHLDVESRISEGSEFSFRLTLPTHSPQRVFPLELHGLKVLIVDDGAFALSLQRGWVEALGYLVETVASGEEALAALMNRSQPFDLVLIDRTLRDMHALDLAAHAKEMSNHASRVILVSTAGDSTFDDDPALVNATLQKPVILTNLYEAVYAAFGFEGHFAVDVASERANEAGNHIAGARVLVVDDAETNLLIAKELLEAHGLDVATAKGGAEAVSKVTSEAFDCVLMDVRMPDVDGLTATRRIRAAGITALPILAMTASAMPEDREQALAAGMNDHVAKPIEPGQVVATLRRWISSAPTTPAAGEVFINVERGMARVVHNRNLYRRLLESFVMSFAETGSSLDDAMSTDNLNAAHAVIHKLTGVASNLGLERLGAVAADLERDIIKGQAVTVKQLELFRHEINLTTAAIEAWLADNT